MRVSRCAAGRLLSSPKFCCLRTKLSAAARPAARRRALRPGSDLHRAVREVAAVSKAAAFRRLKPVEQAHSASRQMRARAAAARAACTARSWRSSLFRGTPSRPPKLSSVSPSPVRVRFLRFANAVHRRDACARSASSGEALHGVVRSATQGARLIRTTKRKGMGSQSGALVRDVRLFAQPLACKAARMRARVSGLPHPYALRAVSSIWRHRVALD